MAREEEVRFLIVLVGTGLTVESSRVVPFIRLARVKGTEEFVSPVDATQEIETVEFLLVEVDKDQRILYYKTEDDINATGRAVAEVDKVVRESQEDGPSVPEEDADPEKTNPEDAR